jgi:predicted transcriptional regulator
MAMTVRLPEELDAQLEALAAAEHVSKHALLIQAAQSLVERRGRREQIMGAIDFVRTHDAVLLERLEDA